jgi:hypothetical protein
MDEWIIPGIAISLVVMGLIGQGFEMRKIRLSIKRDEDLVSPNIFLDKRNIKWYILIGAGIAIWYITGGFPTRSI